MKKQNVSFLIDETVLNSHVGVRKYLFSLAEALRQEFNIRLFNVEYEPINNKPYFTEIFVDNQYVKDNGFSINNFVGKNKYEILKNLSNVFFKKNSNSESKNNIYTCSYGCSLPTDLDMVIISAPWIIKGDLTLNAKRGIYCIAYDAIPNEYSINSPEDKGLNTFAYQHLFTYKTFLSKYDGLLAISSETANQLKAIFPSYKSKINIIPVFLPAGFEVVAKSNAKFKKQEKVVLLASPLDLRKGLKIIPSYINNLTFDRLVIFGAPRCSFQDITNFFNAINTNEITWWSEVNFEKQIELFESSSLLIFPSLNEGLGLPILESYSCGTPAFVSNISPLKNLVSDDYVIGNNFVQICKVIQSTLDLPLENEKLKLIAIDKWGSHNLVNFLTGLGN